jgi:hypothetical protein
MPEAPSQAHISAGTLANGPSGVTERLPLGRRFLPRDACSVCSAFGTRICQGLLEIS